MFLHTHLFKGEVHPKTKNAVIIYSGWSFVVQKNISGAWLHVKGANFEKSYRADLLFWVTMFVPHLLMF